MFGLECLDFEGSSYNQLNVYNPLRLGTVIVLISSGIEFVNTALLYSDRATRWFVPEDAKSAWTLQATQSIMPEMSFEPLNVCLTDRRLNQLS